MKKFPNHENHGLKRRPNATSAQNVQRPSVVASSSRTTCEPTPESVRSCATCVQNPSPIPDRLKCTRWSTPKRSLSPAQNVRLGSRARAASGTTSRSTLICPATSATRCFPRGRR
uniref:(northern house mosquito) hypothetical protein n=1 Tax=Culex pipiens TaxID=7175 RepID=A0A8D8A806_CULPI